ncbi:hypothetical protein D3C81_1937690 [compost metagenome]
MYSPPLIFGEVALYRDGKAPICAGWVPRYVIRRINGLARLPEPNDIRLVLEKPGWHATLTVFSLWRESLLCNSLANIMFASLL